MPVLRPSGSNHIRERWPTYRYLTEGSGKVRVGLIAFCSVVLSSTSAEDHICSGNNDAVAFAYGRKLMIRVPGS